eukprot:3357623-Rhodomonas_salina.1
MWTYGDIKTAFGPLPELIDKFWFLEQPIIQQPPLSTTSGKDWRLATVDDIGAMTKYERSSCLIGQFRTLAFLARESKSKTKSLMKQIKRWSTTLQEDFSDIDSHDEDRSSQSDEDPVIANPLTKKGRLESGRRKPAHQGGGKTSGSRRKTQTRKQ